MSPDDSLDLHSENLEIGLRINCESDAFLVVDSTIHGTSSGGVRILEDVSQEEVHALAREMTLKYSFFGLRRGGAKCGIRLKASVTPAEKAETLREFGKRLSPIISLGLYYPGMDMNCSFTDLQNIYQGAGFPVSKCTDSAYFTALSVAQVLEVLSRQDDVAGPFSLSIAGFGRVAWHLVNRLDMSRFRLVGISTVHGSCYDPGGFNPAEVLEKSRACGDYFVSMLGRELLPHRDDIYGCPVDVLMPAARTDALHAGNARGVEAQHVVPIANKPYTDEALHILEGRGVDCFPGYLCNGGGVFASGLSDAGESLQVVEWLCASQFRLLVGEMLKRSREGKQTIHEIARELAVSSRLRLRRERLGTVDRLLRRFGSRWELARGVVRRKLYENLVQQFDSHVRYLQTH